MNFQDALKIVREKFSFALENNALELDSKNVSEALIITVLSEFERQRVGIVSHADNYRKTIESHYAQIEHNKNEIKKLELQIEECNKKILYLEKDAESYGAIVSTIQSTVNLFLARAAQLKEEERRHEEEKKIKELALKEFEEKKRAEEQAQKEAELAAMTETVSSVSDDTTVNAEKPAKPKKERKKVKKPTSDDKVES